LKIVKILNKKILINVFFILFLILNLSFLIIFQKIKTLNVTKNTVKTKKITNIKENFGATEESSSKNGYDAMEIWERLSKNNHTPLEYKTGENKKTIFLTFDDGPSINTIEILEILKRYDVKATFFCIGSKLNNKFNSSLFKKEFTEGHAIGNHSYTHEYSYIYPNNSINIKSFTEEFNKADEQMKKILGKNFKTRLFRCPGGSMSRNGVSELKKHLKNNNMALIDWNVDSCDKRIKKSQKKRNKIFKKIINSSKNKDMIVLLMHDSKREKETVKILPDVIEYFKSKDFTFKILV
jgi:peptidoglycan/xylan/chitin deacetylase (PgdA/CDA1 family)